ncbi:MAG: type III-B CRISPR module RAMP protein Cmr1 [Chloroflexi bacterium]|nr:type III-B CRISPR module RAMP protein Cmr1 [Chloroflexota bacterium]
MHLNFTLETLTPLFLGGADQDQDVELRPASVRGALRFWYRALYAGIHGDDVRALQHAEGDLFGDTTAASRILVKLAGNLTAESPPVTPPAREGDPGGAAYMFWSVLRQKRQAFLPNGKTFSLELQTRRVPRQNQTDDETMMRASLAALWLLTHLGGLGARARRGGGNLALHPTDPTQIPSGLPAWETRAHTAAELQRELADGIHQCRAALRCNAWCDQNEIAALPAFDILHPQTCSIRVWNRAPFPNWQTALEAIGQAFKNFRSRKPESDYATVKAAVDMQSDSLDPVQRAAFGLPIVFYYRSLQQEYQAHLYQQFLKEGMSEQEASRKANRQARKEATGTLEGETHERRASPLSFRLTRLANGQFVIVLVYFKARLLGMLEREGRSRPEKLKLRREGNAVFANTPSLNLIDDFIASLGNTTEVDFR